MDYRGFEQGPIRPPSEAHSLLVRVTRNCPWNRCRFCPVYKGTSFSRRPVEHVLSDIDAVAGWVEVFESGGASPETANGRIQSGGLIQVGNGAQPEDQAARQAALNWYRWGMKSVFLQDANALATPAAELVAIVSRLKERFPAVERITSYARSQTVARLRPEDLAAVRAAGLDRAHIGFETGSDEILAFMEKGVSRPAQVEAGRKIKQAGMELSAYYMPGLGGRALWRENALETADLMNKVDPDFIRLRTLAVPDHLPLAEDVAVGRFTKAGDVETAQEILLFIESLEGIGSVIVSDHVLNLFQDLEGKLPEDRGRMVAEVRAFLALDPEEQLVYRVGRRRGVFAGLADMQDERQRAYAGRICRDLGVTTDNVDEVTDRLVARFV